MNEQQWQASLALRFARRDQSTILAGRSHRGPLRVQRPLYPEGEACCHAVILHPPGGIAGGDDLAISVEAASGCAALLTTPGAGKWYGSNGKAAAQRVRLHLAGNSRLEWLPQENIFFPGCQANLSLEVTMDAEAVFIGLESCCLGRVAAGEDFAHGGIALESRIVCDGRLLFAERGHLEGGSPWLHAKPGLNGSPFFATLLVVAPGLDKSLLDACRQVEEGAAIASGLSLLPGGLLVGRCLGQSAESLQHWFLRLWRVLRPALMQRPAIVPRIWNT